MKINHFLPSNSVGGAPKNVARLIALTEYDQDAYFWKEEPNIGVPILNGSGLGSTFASRLFSLVIILFQMPRSQIICTHGRGMGLVVRPIALLLGFYVIHSFRGYREKRYKMRIFGWPLNKIVFFLEFLFSKYSTNIAVGTSEYLTVERDLDPPRLIKIYNPVTIEDQETSDPVIKIRDVVFVGRRSYQKGYDKFRKRFASIEGITFAWFGNGEDVDCSNDTVHYKSGGVFAAKLDINREISQSRIFVSLSRWEGASTVVIEALMLGIPVIALSCQGVDEFILGTGAGRIVSEDNLIDEIQELLRDESLYRMLSENTRNIHDIINLKNIKDRYCLIFNGI